MPIYLWYKKLLNFNNQNYNLNAWIINFYNLPIKDVIKSLMDAINKLGISVLSAMLVWLYKQTWNNVKSAVFIEYYDYLYKINNII